MADSRQMFQDLIGEANRTSTSFYTVDAAGLRTEGRPITDHAGRSAASRRATASACPSRRRSTRSARSASATNGLAIVDSNDFKTGLQRIADDLNAYYLLGYTSSNGKADGKYRKIKVTVKRPGVQVRAREGYLARRIDDPPASSPSASCGALPRRTRRRRCSPLRWAG